MCIRFDSCCLLLIRRPPRSTRADTLFPYPTLFRSNVKKFCVPAVIAINRFVKDTDAELKAIQEFAKTQGVEAVACEHWGKGSEGTEELAHKDRKSTRLNSSQ